MKPIVVLGSGLAGYTLVRELRKLDRDIPITMVSNGSGDYYSKPMLSNAFAQGKEPASLVLTSGPSMAEQLGFTLLAHTEVRAIHRVEKQLDTSSGVVDYDRLVLASGADPIRIPLQGDAADSVLSVNDLEDYAIFRDALGTAKSIAIMGGGLIGCEFANDLAVAGYKVTVIDPGPYPLSGLMPEQAGRQLLEPLFQTGVTWRFGTAVHSVNSSGAGYSLTLADEAEMYADVVLSAVGLRPRIGLARDAGLAVNRGIVVDEQLRSSDETIDGRVLPYVLPIMQAGRTLAKVLNGEDARVVFPFMPVVVKTPAHPVVVSPVAHDAAGAWQVLERGQGIKMGFFNVQDEMTGFVITGEYAVERTAMTARCVSKS
jgi:rubredoxin-NAD+ reductase